MKESRDNVDLAGPTERLWKDTRWQALRSVVALARDTEDELSWLSQVSTGSRPEVLRAVFEFSRKLGRQIASQRGGSLSIGEVIELLSRSRVTCFEGAWKSEDHGLSRTLCRKFCPFVSGTFGCDYWREAAAGLVAGLSTELAFARHTSLGHGDGQCVNAVYVWPCLDKKYAAVSKPILRALKPVLDDLNRWKTTLQLEGYAEGILHVKLGGVHLPVCGTCRDKLLSRVRQLISRAAPGVEVEEDTPPFVLEGTAPTVGNPDISRQRAFTNFVESITL